MFVGTEATGVARSAHAVPHLDGVQRATEIGGRHEGNVVVEQELLRPEETVRSHVGYEVIFVGTARTGPKTLHRSSCSSMLSCKPLIRTRPSCW